VKIVGLHGVFNYFNAAAVNRKTLRDKHLGRARRALRECGINAKNIEKNQEKYYKFQMK